MYLVGNLESWKKELAADHQRPSDKPDRPWKKGLLPDGVGNLQVAKVCVQHRLAIESVLGLDDCIPRWQVPAFHTCDKSLLIPQRDPNNCSQIRRHIALSVSVTSKADQLTI